MPEVSQEEIDELVGAPGVLDRVIEATATYSKVVGERDLLRLLFLAFLSAQLELLPNGKPLGANCILSAPHSRGKNYLADAVARVLPEEFYYTFEAASPKSLFYKAKMEGPECLKHRAIYPNEAEAVDPLVETFRPVLSGGRAKHITVGKDGGRQRPPGVQAGRAHGPHRAHRAQQVGHAAPEQDAARRHRRLQGPRGRPQRGGLRTA